jgi:hypothetical protein
VQQQKVLVQAGADVLAPLVSDLPAIVGECAVTVTEAPRASKKCAGMVTATTRDPLSYTKQGSYTITWVYNDGNGTALRQQQKVIVKDSTRPVPAMDSLPVITGDCAVTVMNRPTAYDNCAGLITGTTSDSLTYHKQGEYIITWTYNDGHNNLTTQQQKLVVRSGGGVLTPLTANLPDIVSECAVTVTDIPLAAKNCAGIFAASTADPLTYSKQGSYTIVWTFNDYNGATLKQQQRIIIKDTSRPVPQTDSLPVISGDCSVTVTNRPTATDNCAVTIQAVTADPLHYTEPGNYTIHWLFDDGNGNTVFQQQKLVVRGGSGPLTPLVASLPDITGDCYASVISQPRALTACGNTVTATTPDPLQYSRQGEHIITWTYNDGRGNKAVQQQKVIIQDRTAPVPAVQLLPDITGECSARVTEIPVAFDNCAGKITGVTTDPLTYTKQGIHLVTWQYNDGNGNQYTQQQKIIIKNPVTLLPRFLTLPDIVSECALTVTARPTIQDYCLGSITGSTTDSLVFTRPGVYTIFWKYITSSDDTVIQKQSVIVKKLSLAINAYPNPASNYFTLTVKSCNQTDKINLRVFDVLGRIIENRTVLPYAPVTLGTQYAAAAYFVQVVQGKETVTSKLVKVQ